MQQVLLPPAQGARSVWLAACSAFRYWPVQRARLASHQVSEAEIATIEREIDLSIQESVRKASQAPIPTSDRLYAGVFHEKA